jgi:hypothetical protein
MDNAKYYSYEKALIDKVRLERCTAKHTSAPIRKQSWVLQKAIYKELVCSLPRAFCLRSSLYLLVSSKERFTIEAFERFDTVGLMM